MYKLLKAKFMFLKRDQADEQLKRENNQVKSQKGLGWKGP